MKKGALGVLLILIEKHLITMQDLKYLLERSERSIWNYVRELKDNDIIINFENGFFILESIGIVQAILKTDDINKLQISVCLNEKLTANEKQDLCFKLMKLEAVLKKTK